MKLPVIQASRAATAVFALAAAKIACADDANSNPTLPAVIGPGEIFNMGTSLLLIIVVIVVVGWLYSRTQRMQSHDGDVIRILAAQPIGPKERVLLVEVAGKQLVLGMTAGQIQMLYVLEQPLEAASQAPSPTGFAKRLRTAIEGVRK